MKIINNKKGIIVALLLVIVFVVIFSFGTNVTRLLSSTYDIDQISSNIDQIQIGDKINYSANGIDDWEVISVNKGNNTIEIVSSEEVERLTLTGYYDWLDASEKMQKIADKYVTGEYAIGARNLKSSDISNTNITKTGCVWLDEQSLQTMRLYDLPYSYNQTYFCEGYGSLNYENLAQAFDDYYGVLVVVTLDDNNANNYNIGDNYTYTSNGINDWKVLYINSESSISIVTSNKQPVDLATEDYIKKGDEYFEKYLLDYYDDNVTNVRFANINDGSNLMQAGIKINSGSILTGVFSGPTYSNEWYSTYGKYTYKFKYDEYRYEYMYYYDYYGAYQRSDTGRTFYSRERGVRPVIILKYSDELIKDGNELTTDLRVGDHVKYEANSYFDWKVLSINEDEGTAEIVSSSIVKLLTLSGIEDYENLENIFQEEVDDYLNGDIAISARMLNSSDIETLTMMKDNCEQVYWLNNKKKHKYNNGFYLDESEDVYSAATAVYNRDSLNIVRQWAMLRIDLVDISTILSSKTPGSYEYTAGIRPVIKVKLEELTKDDSNEIPDSEIKVPENKEELVPDNEIISNDNQNNEINNNLDHNENNENNGQANSCIVYDDDKNSSDNEKKYEVVSNGISNQKLVLIIISSILAGSVISGIIMYNIYKRKIKR